MNTSIPANPMTPRETVVIAQKTGLDLLARSLRRHWRTILAMTAGLSALLIIALALTPASYSVSTYLMVAERPNVVNIQDVLPALTADTELLASDIEILRSRDLTREVARRLHMTAVPGSQKKLGNALTDFLPVAMMKQIEAAKSWLKEQLLPPPLPPDEQVITYLRENLTIAPLGKSRVIQIRFTAKEAQVARDVANAYAQAFIDYQVNEKTKASIAAKSWVDSEIERLRKQVQADEHKLENYRARSGLTENGNRLLLPYGQLADLDHRLTVAQTEYAAVKARADAVHRMEQAGTLMNAVPETIGSPALQAMREREAKLTIDRAALTQQYSSGSDRIRRIDAEMGELRGSIRSELSHIAAGLESEAQLASTTVSQLKSAETSAKNRLESASDESVGLLSLQREVDAGRDLLVTLLRRQNELASQVSLQNSDASVISMAPLPLQPSFPKMLPMALLAIVASMVASVGYSLWADLKDRLVRSTDELAVLLPYPTLGLLPSFDAVHSHDHLNAMSKDRTRYAEAVKNLYIQTTPPDRPMPQSIVISSAISGEGKTTTAISLALLAASLGRNVVLVDFDMRRPSVHNILRLPLGPGLMEYLSGETSSLAEVVQYPLPNLAVITAGRGSDFNSVVRTELVEGLLKHLKQKFDQVIIDTPPILAVVDPLIVARLADRVIHVVRWAQTMRETVRAAAGMLDTIDPRRIGAVLTQVDVERHAAEGYGDSVIYHKSFNRYYLG